MWEFSLVKVLGVICRGKLRDKFGEGGRDYVMKSWISYVKVCGFYFEG